jgi:hypothetical protein
MSKERMINPSEGDLLNKCANTVKFLKDRGYSRDCDSTDAFSEELAMKLLKAEYGSHPDIGNKRIEDLKSRYDMLIWLEGMGVKNPHDKAIGYWNSDKLSLLRPLPGALIISNYLMNEGLEIKRITHRPSRVRKQTIKWYRETMGVDEHLVFMTDRDEISRDLKQRIIEKYRIGVHEDDAQEELERIIIDTDALTVLVPRPWNEGYLPKNPSRMLTVDSALECGLPSLGISAEEFKSLPIAVQTHMVLVDYVNS